MAEGNVHNVRVLLRIRPPPAQDTETFNIRFGEKKWDESIDQERVSTLSIPVDAGDKVFNFDEIYSTKSAQKDVYRGIRSSVLSTIHGYNATIFSFGATASGKTHSMCGSEEDYGIMHRATVDIFQAVETLKMQKSNSIFNIELSIVELYNNQFRNLLRPDHNSTYRSNNLSSDINSAADSAHSDASLVPYPTFSGRIGSFADKIELHESPITGVFLVGHPNIRVPVKSIEDAHSLISKGLSSRKIGSTAYNSTSSRSHTILTVHVESVDTIDGDIEKILNSKSEVRLGKLHLIDLAGEKLSSLRSEESSSPVETQYINLSILALGEVLQKLTSNAMSTNRFVASKSKSKTTNQNSLRGRLFWDSPPRGRNSFGGDAEAPKMSHVPYYDSKLTHLLKDSLGGNCQTTMLTHISPALEDYHKSLNTLIFCSRVSSITNYRRINKVPIGVGEFLNIKSESSLIRALKAQYMREFELSVITSTKMSKVAAVVNKSKRISSVGSSRSRPSTPQGESNGSRNTTDAAIILKSEMEVSLARMNETESLLNFKCTSLEEKLLDLEFQVNAVKNFRKLYHEKNIKDLDHEKKGLESLVSVMQKSEGVLRENLDIVNRNYMKLQSDYQQLSEAHRRGVDVVGSTELQFNSLQRDYESLREEHTKQSNILQHSSQQLSIKDSEVKSLETELTGVRSELLFQLSINESQHTELNLTKDEVVRCKQSLDDQKLKIHAMKEEAAMFSALNTQQINDLTSETTRLKAEVDALQISLQYANENCNNAKSYSDKLLATRSEMEGKLGGLQTAIDGHEKQSTQLQQELIRVMDQIGNLSAESSSLKQENSLLRQQTSNLHSECSELKAELERANKERGQKTSQCGELAEANRCLEEKLRSIDSDATENRLLQQQQQQQQQSLQSLTADIESKNSELEVLTINLRESERKCSNLLDNKKNIEATFERELEGVRLKLKGKSEEVTLLESELRTLRFTLSSLQEEYSAAQRKVGKFQGIQSETVQVERQLRDEISKLGKQLRQALDSKNELLERTKRENEAAHHAAVVRNEEIDSLTSELDILQSEFSSVKDELEEVKQELQQRLSEMVKMSELERSLRNENLHLRDVIGAKDRCVESSERKLITLQQSQSEISTDVNFLRGNLVRSLADLDTMGSEAARLRIENSDLELKVKHLEVYSRELSSAKESDRIEIEQNKQKILSLNDELLKLRSTVASLQFDLQKKEKSFANDREMIKSMQTSLEESNSKLSARVKELIKIKAVEDERYNQELSALQKGLAEKMNEVSLLTTELELSRGALTSLRGDFARAQEILTERTEELGSSMMECSALREKLSRIQENDQENFLLYQRINELGSTLQSTEIELVSYKSKLSNQLNESRSATAQLDRLNAEVQEHRDRAAHLTGSVDTLQREKDAAVKQIAVCKKEIERLQQDKLSYSSNLDRQRTENSYLSSKIADLYRQHLSDVENAKREVSSLKRERDEAINRCRMLEESMQLAADNSREVDRYIKEINALKQALVEKSGQVDIYLEQVQKLRIDLDLLGESKIRALCESEKRFLAERQSNKEQQSAMEEVLKSLEAVKQNTASVNEQLQGEIKKLQMDSSNQSKLLLQKQDELAVAEETTEKYRRQLQETGSAISAELQLLKAETSRCKTLLTEKSAEIMTLREERMQLVVYRDEYLTQKSKDSERMGSEIQTLKNLLLVRSGDISNLSKENEELSRRIVDCSSSVDKLQNELLVTKQLLKNKTLAFDNSITENEELRSKLSDFCSREERTVEKIRKDLAASRQAFDEKNDEANRLALENLSLLDKLSLSSDLKSAELSTAQQEAATFKANLAEITSKNSFLESEFHRVESKCNQMIATHKKDYEDHLLALKQAHLLSNDKDKEVANLLEQLSLLTEQEVKRAKYVDGLQETLQKSIAQQFETEKQSKEVASEFTRHSTILEAQLAALRQDNSKLSNERDMLLSELQNVSKEKESIQMQLEGLKDSTTEEIARLAGALSSSEISVREKDLKWKQSEEKVEKIYLELEQENQNKSACIQQKIELEEEIQSLWTFVSDHLIGTVTTIADTPTGKVISIREQFILLRGELNALKAVNEHLSDQLRLAMEAYSTISDQLVGVDTISVSSKREAPSVISDQLIVVENISESSQLDSLNEQVLSAQNVGLNYRQSEVVAVVDIDVVDNNAKGSYWTGIVQQVDFLRTRKVSLESSIACTEEILKELTQKDDIQRGKIQLLEEESAKLLVKIHERDENIEQLHAEITKLTTSLAIAKSDGVKLNDEHFNQLQKEKEDHKNALLEWERTVETLQSSLNSTKDDLLSEVNKNKITTEESAKLSVKIHERDENIEQLHAEITKLTTSLAIAKSDSTKLLDEHFNQLQKEKEDHKNALLEWERTVETLQSSLSSTKDDLLSEVNKNKITTEESAKLSVKIHERDESIELLHAEITKLTTSLAIAKSDSTKSLDEHFNQLRKEKEDHKNGLLEWERTVEMLQMSLNSTKDDLLSEINKNKITSDEVLLLENEYKALQDLLTQERESSRVEMSHLKEENGRLLQSLLENSRRCDSLEEELKASREKSEAQVLSLTERISLLIKSQQNLQLQCQQQQEEMHDKEKTFETTVQAKDEEIAIVQKRLLDSQHEVDVTSRKMSDLVEEKLQLSQEHESEINANRLGSANELAALKSKHEEEVRVLKTTIDNDSSSLNSMKSELESTQAVSCALLQQKEKEIANLADTLSQLNQQLSGCNHSLGISQETVELLRTKISEKELISKQREADLTSELHSLKRSSIERELELKNKVVEVETRESEALIALRSVSDELCECKVGCADLKTQLFQSSQVIENFRREISESSQALVLKASRVVILENDLELVTSERETMRGLNNSLESAIRECHNAASETENKLNALTISHEELSMSSQKLSADHSRVLIAHGQETRSLQAAIYAKTEELAQHKSEKKALLQEKATILSQCDCLNKEVISLQSELAIAHAVRIELTEKLEEKCLEWEKLSDDLLSLSDSCKAKEIEAMDQVEEIRHLESCITQLKNDLKTLDDNLKVKSNEGLILEQQNSKWREQNASLEGDLSTLNLAADSLREELNSLLLNLAEKDALVSQLIDQKETLQIALSEREKVVQATRADLESTAHDRRALQDKLSDAQKSLDANSKRIEELNKELYSVRRTTTTQLQAAADSVSESKKDLLVMSISFDSLRDDCNTRIDQVQKAFLLRENKLTHELRDKASYATTLEAKIHNQEERYTDESNRLLTKLKESSVSLEQMKRLLTCSETDRSALTAERDALEHRIIASQKYFEETVAAMTKDHAAQINILQVECDGLRDHQSTLKQKLLDAESKYEREKSDMDSLLQEKEQASAKALEELHMLRRQTLQLNSELDDLKIRLSVSAEGSTELKNKVTQLTAELKSSLSLSERLRQENEGLVGKHATETSETHRKLEDMRFNLNDKNNELEQHSTQITELMHVLGMHTAELQTVCTENNSLQDRLHSAMEQTERLQRDLVFLNQVCNSRGNELEDMSKELEALRYQRNEETSRFSESISQLKQQFELRTTEWHAVKEELEKARRKSDETIRDRAREEERVRQVSAKLQQSSQQLHFAEAELMQARQRLQGSEAEFSEATQRVEEITNLLTIKAAEAEDMTNFEIKLLIHLIKNRKKLTLVLNNNGTNSSNKSIINNSMKYS